MERLSARRHVSRFQREMVIRKKFLRFKVSRDPVFALPEKASTFRTVPNGEQMLWLFESNS
jgi:hypothetical protein